jgi:hypothetical protein
MTASVGPRLKDAIWPAQQQLAVLSVSSPNPAGMRPRPAGAACGLKYELESTRHRPVSVNPVVLALVAALRDVEARRARGNVLTDLTPKERHQ